MIPRKVWCHHFVDVAKIWLERAHEHLIDLKYLNGYIRPTLILFKHHFV